MRSAPAAIAARLCRMASGDGMWSAGTFGRNTSTTSATVAVSARDWSTAGGWAERLAAANRMMTRTIVSASASRGTRSRNAEPGGRPTPERTARRFTNATASTATSSAALVRTSDP